MNKTIALLSFASCLVAAACGGASPPAATSAAAPASQSTSLDGTSYEVSLEFAGEAPVKDVLSFDRGNFESSACTGLGFPKWTQYRCDREGDAIGFHVETRNPKGPTVEWSGTVQGGTASGKAKRTIDGKTDVGTFQGSAR
jgi:hypothetical protein